MSEAGVRFLEFLDGLERAAMGQEVPSPVWVRLGAAAVLRLAVERDSALTDAFEALCQEETRTTAPVWWLALAAHVDVCTALGIDIISSTDEDYAVVCELAAERLVVDRSWRPSVMGVVA